METKVCAKCGVEKPLDDFHKGKSRCKTCRKIDKAKYNENNREGVRESSRNYYASNKEKESDRKKKYYKENKDSMSARMARWKSNNRMACRVIEKRHVAKKYRNLGYIPLNSGGPGLVGHHIDEGHVMYIPEELHASIQHSISDPYSMDKINLEAWRWFYSN